MRATARHWDWPRSPPFWSAAPARMHERGAGTRGADAVGDSGDRARPLCRRAKPPAPVAELPPCRLQHGGHPLRPLDRRRRARLRRIHRRHRRVQLPHREHLPARPGQSVPRRPIRQGIYFHADCADLPYFLRAYYAWKRGPAVRLRERGGAARPRATSAIPQTATRCRAARRDLEVRPPAMGFWKRCATRSLRRCTASIPSSNRRRPDHYSPKIDAKSIRPGHGDLRSQRASGHGLSSRAGRAHPLHRRPSRQFADAGHLRPALRALAARHGRGLQELAADEAGGRDAAGRGHPDGGHMELAANADIADFSDEQFYGNVPKSERRQLECRQLQAERRIWTTTTMCAPRWRADSCSSIR